MVEGIIFTSEPQAMRAVAAEFRANPKITEKMLSQVTGRTLGSLQSVRCEASDHENLDVLLVFDNGVVGIEGKIGHLVTEEQLVRERATVDALLLLCKERIDVERELLQHVTAVVTWEDILNEFPNSRITVKDIDMVEDANRRTRNLFRGLDLELIFSEFEGWEYRLTQGNTGFPSIDIYGPDFIGSDGTTRYFVAQIEPERSGSERKFASTIGVRVYSDEFDINVETEPEWVGILKKLGPVWEDALVATLAPISQHRSGGSSQTAVRKKELAEKFGLPSKYAKGYTDSYLGVKTSKVNKENLSELVKVTIAALKKGSEVI